jgi:hypothetical protein
MSQVRSPREAVDARTQMVQGLEDERAQAILRATLESMSTGTGRDVSGLVSEMVSRYNSGFRTFAETCWVSPQMHDFAVLAAAEFVPGEDRIDLGRLPIDDGLLFLPKPLMVTDVRGEKYGIEALLWRRRGNGGKEVVLYSLISATDAQVWRDKPRPVPVITRYELLSMALPTEDDFVIGPEEERRDAYRRYEDSDDTLEISDEVVDVLVSQVSPVHYWWSVMLLMGQTLVSTAVETATGSTAKRARRAALPPQITVIELRKRASVGPKDHEPSGRTYHHRWLVRGHWRWQRYGDGSMRRIYIKHYWKGPEDAPLLVSHKVNALLR